MNFKTERFETLESSINFNQREFIEDCKEQMHEYCIEIKELAKACYIPTRRIAQIFNCKDDAITEEEIREIKKKLNLS
jgi:hypothetical protein